MATTKISPYDLPSLKNTTDDALQNYLTSIGFAQSHYLTDIRLALGYVAVLIGAGTFVADYKLGWDATKDWTAVAVVVYFALNGAFTYWIWAVERGMVFEGERKGGKIQLASRTKKLQPTYYLSITSNDQTTELTAPFTTWFTADGFFVAKPFQQWIASSCAAIGEADSVNAAAAGSAVGGESSEKKQVEEEGVVVGDGGLQNASASASGSLQSKATGSKRAKRKG